MGVVYPYLADCSKETARAGMGVAISPNVC